MSQLEVLERGASAWASGAAWYTRHSSVGESRPEAAEAAHGSSSGGPGVGLGLGAAATPTDADCGADADVAAGFSPLGSGEVGAIEAGARGVGDDGGGGVVGMVVGDGGGGVVSFAIGLDGGEAGAGQFRHER